MSLEDFGAAHLRGWLWLGTQSINKPSNFHTEGPLLFLFAFFLFNFFRLLALENGRKTQNPRFLLSIRSL